VIQANNGSNGPVFSVVLPTHNRAALLERAVQCVLNQTFSDFELIIIDDASNDETAECVKAFSDSRIRSVRLNQNQGAAAARNIGISRSCGKLVTFLDDDDECFPDLLAETFHAFRDGSETVGFGWSGIRRVAKMQDEEVLLKEWRWPDDVKRSQPLVYMGVGTGYGLTVRRSCFDTVGVFDEGLRAYEDLDLLIRLGSHFDFVVVPGIHVKVYRHAGDQLTDINARGVNALEQVIRKNAEILEKNPTAWMKLQSRAAEMHFQLGNKRRGQLFLLEMLRKKPLQISLWKRILYREFVGASEARRLQA
jgi:glycosyltransferase involved in cell wall biosynthesis